MIYDLKYLKQQQFKHYYIYLKKKIILELINFV